MAEINLLEKYPKSRRNVTQRSSSKTPEIIQKAKEFGFEYFDGPREYGYGGYRYDGRWLPVARDIVDYFDLKPGDRVLDIGCAKGFLVKDLMHVCPGLNVFGLDVSKYAIDNSEEEIRPYLTCGNAKSIPFSDGFFKAALCINVIHNLDRQDCIKALKEIQRVSNGNAYVQVDAYHTQEEYDIFQDWVLTAETFLKPNEWQELFEEAGYLGDYYWTILDPAPKWNQ